ncbi:MAG: 50S ribosomal protein L10 [Candidatus Aureabacteria bacterium]|nr:50S ribosomal protein L10 [Candidatus Auribacterota bacterium]
MRPEKKIAVKEMKQKLDASGSFILTDYVGISAEEMTKLRTKLSEKSANFMIVKNRLFSRTAKESGFDGIDQHLKGPTAVAFLGGDVVAGTKAVVDFGKESGKLGVKCAIFNNKVINADKVKELANLPSREVLLGIVAGTIQAPISAFVRVLNARLSSLVYVINAILNKKESN